MSFLLLAALLVAPAAAQDVPTPARQKELLRLVRQDCGSCHGMHLTGGLGPPLAGARFREWPLESLVATIAQGRAGTAMPGWAPLLSRTDVDWIARQLQAGMQEDPQ